MFLGNKDEIKVKVESGHFSCLDSIQGEQISSSTHSWAGYYMKLNGQLHVLATLCPDKKTISIPFIGSCMGTTASPDVQGKRKISCSWWESNPGSSSPQDSHYNAASTTPTCKSEVTIWNTRQVTTTECGIEAVHCHTPNSTVQTKVLFLCATK